MKRALYSVVAMGIFLLGGCERPATESKPSGEKSAPGSKAAGLPAGLFVPTEPADAKSVIDAKRDAKAGEPIVIRGRVGGAVDPFVAERAIFTIVDKSIPHCGEMKMDDACTTPWDYCCEPGDKLAEHSATIQIVTADGRPLKTEVKNVPELKPTSEIVVKGKVAQKEGAKVLVVNAESIFVKS
jgi:hypothetical protein